MGLLKPKAILLRVSGMQTRKKSGCREGHLPNEGLRVSLKYIEHGVYGDLIMIYPKPYSIYLRGSITLNAKP